MINYDIMDWLSIRIIGKNLALSYNSCELRIESTRQQDYRGKREYAGLKLPGRRKHLLVRSELVFPISACVYR